MRKILLIVSLFVFSCSLVYAEESADKCPPKPCLKEEMSITDHSITLNGVDIKYKAYAATLLLKDEKRGTQG